MSVAIRIAETITVQSIMGLQRDLQSALACGDAIVLDCSGLREADLSFLQLIEATRQQARRDDAAVTLSGPANPCVAALLKRAGFLDQPSPDDVDFWFHGELPQ